MHVTIINEKIGEPGMVRHAVVKLCRSYVGAEVHKYMIVTSSARQH